MNQNDELYHYGVPGMKWGRRRAIVTSSGSSNVARARTAYKSAKKQYNKDFNDAYNKSIGAYSPFKKHRQASADRWKKANTSAEKMNKAKSDYKAQKEKGKAAIERAKAKYKAAKEKYTEDYDNANAYSSTHMISQFLGGKNQRRSDANWDKALKSGEAAERARKAYKAAKRKYR